MKFAFGIEGSLRVAGFARDELEATTHPEMFTAPDTSAPPAKRSATLLQLGKSESALTWSGRFGRADG